MSHMPGHIDEPPKSNGDLSPIREDGTKAKQIAIPESYKGQFQKGEFEKGQHVGFHPRRGENGKVFAYDLVDWLDHQAAEAILLKDQELNLNIGELEELHFKPELRERITNALNAGRFQEHKDVIAKTLEYLSSSDFQHFYLNEKGQLRTLDEIIDTF